MVHRHADTAAEEAEVVKREHRERLAQALDYQQRGLPLLPVDPDARGGKQPNFEVLESVYRARSWGQLGERPASPPEIEAWFAAEPGTNVGIICGKASGLVVADVDHPDKAKLRHPPTPIAQARRGPHLYFAGQGPGRGFAWGELKGDKSYVVAPPAPGRTWLIGLNDADAAPIEELRSDGATVSLLPPGPPVTQVGTTTCGHPYESDSLDPTGRRYATNALAVERALRVLGIPLGKKKFSCILPGHGPDRHPSAAIHQDTDGVFRYKDFHKPCAPDSLTLAEVRASLAAGRIVELAAPSQARWYRRLFYEAGLIELDLRPLDVHACSDNARRVAEGFALLFALRGLDDEGPVPFARAFAGPWCGMDPKAAYRGFRELRALGLIVKAGMHGRTHLWLPAGPNKKQRAR